MLKNVHSVKSSVWIHASALYNTSCITNTDVGRNLVAKSFLIAFFMEMIEISTIKFYAPRKETKSSFPNK